MTELLRKNFLKAGQMSDFLETLINSIRIESEIPIKLKESHENPTYVQLSKSFFVLTPLSDDNEPTY